MILVIGGTHEGAELCHWLLANAFTFKLSVATDLGKKIYEAFGSACEVHRFTEDSLTKYIKNHKIKLIVDTTHPHAYEVKQVALKAANLCGIDYLRLDRKMMELHRLERWKDELNQRLTAYSNMEEAVANLKINHQRGHKYLITGTKYIQLFYDNFPKDCLFFRVMPSLYSIKECTQLEVPLTQIIGVKAPCPPELNQAFFTAYGITHFVFKESGEGSATKENLESLKDIDVKGIMIRNEITPSVFEATHFNSLESLQDHLTAIQDLYGGTHE